MTVSLLATKALSGFISALRFEDIPTPVINAVKSCMLDCLGVAVAASACDESSAALHRAVYADSGSSIVFGYGSRLSPTSAALVNGALVHALNFDPIGEAAGHLGVVCLAAPFALAERTNASGRELVTAAVAACETLARITSAVVVAGRRPSEKFLSGQLLSYFGAAAGASRTLRLDVDAVHSALGLALMQMSGSRQVSLATGAPAKSIYGAFPNHGGVLSAMLAREGLDARCDIFGEPTGLLPAIYGGGIDAEFIVQDLRRDYRLMDVAIKPWPSSNQTFLHVEAALEAHRKIARGGDIVAVQIVADGKVANWCEPFSSKIDPPNAAMAANSIPFCVASALARGRFDLSSLADVANNANPTRQLLGRMRYVLTNTPGVARVEVTLKNGEVIIGDARERPGGSGVDETILLAKFHACMNQAARPMSRSSQEQLASLFLDMEREPSVSRIAALLAE